MKASAKPHAGADELLVPPPQNAPDSCASSVWSHSPCALVSLALNDEQVQMPTLG